MRSPKLDQAEQEAFARWLPDELAAQRRWDELLDRSSNQLKASLPKLLPNAGPAVHSHWVRTACERAEHAVLS